MNSYLQKTIFIISSIPKIEHFASVEWSRKQRYTIIAHRNPSRIIYYQTLTLLMIEMMNWMQSK